MSPAPPASGMAWRRAIAVLQAGARVQGPRAVLDGDLPTKHGVEPLLLQPRARVPRRLLVEQSCCVRGLGLRVNWE